MLELKTTTAELLALIGQLTMENRILRQKIAELERTPTSAQEALDEARRTHSG